jgi:hypothetical protein
LGPLLVAAGLGLPAEHALILLLALNGLRVFEATGARDPGTIGCTLPEIRRHIPPRGGARIQ